MARTRPWALVAAVLVGMAAGLGAFTFGYARGYAYLTNDPKACAQCHIMREHFDAWAKGSHHAVATCNDCHTPHNLVGKYTVKARNGFWHSFYFTTGRFPDPIRITPRNHEVTEHACRYCHAEITEAIDHGPGSVSDMSTDGEAAPHNEHAVEPISCVRCHPYVGHWVR